MRTITKEFTKEQLQQIIETDHVQCGEASALARIALASLEAEVAGFIVRHKGTGNFGSWLHSKADWFKSDEYEVLRAYTAPPAPVSVPDEDLLHMAASAIDDLLSNKDRSGAGVWADIPAKLRRAAMLQAEPVSNSDELPLDYLQGHKDGLEWAAQLAEANHPQTGDWLYDDPIDLARAIRKGPDMPTVQGGNSPVIPDEVLSAIRKVARIRTDFDHFDGDRRGIGDCLDEAEQELIVTINKYASQLAAEPIATNDVREQQTAVPPIQADVAQAIENLKQKLVECNRYNYCADAVKNVEDACHAAMLQGADVSLTHEGKNHHEDKLGMVNHLGDVTEKVEPVTQIEPVADLYGLTSPTGGETSFTFDAVEARDFIDGGWSCQEYVELGRYQEALTDHSEDKLAMVDHSGDSNNMVEPVTTANKLLDGWVACSERMPEDDDFVYIWPRPDFGVELHVGQYCECHPKGDGWYAQVYEQNYGIEWCSITVTHWMPLPAAPQQEVTQALAKGMERYGDAMQKLADSGD